VAGLPTHGKNAKKVSIGRLISDNEVARASEGASVSLVTLLLFWQQHCD